MKARANFLFPGIANLEELRAGDPSLAAVIDQMVLMRDALNAALAIEGQRIVGDAPHAPFYFDYLDSKESNCVAFTDPDHSFIGMSVRRFTDVLTMAQQLAADDGVVLGMGLRLTTNRPQLGGLLLWILMVFAVSHEYAHHTHGHLANVGLRRQASEIGADGWAAFLALNHYILADGRAPLVSLLSLEDAPIVSQDVAACSCVIAAHAAFTFAGELQPLDMARLYGQSHPLHSLRLHLTLQHVRNFADGFRPALHDALTPAWYRALLDAVSNVIWRGTDQGGLWNKQSAFLGTADGTAYAEAIVAELNDLLATLRKWEDHARGSSDSTPPVGFPDR